MHRPFRKAILLLSLSMVAGACTAAGSETRSRGSVAASNETTKVQGKSGKDVDADTNSEPRRGTSADTSPGDRRPTRSSAKEAHGGTRHAYASFTETEPDREGDPEAPSYAELTGASVEAVGDDALFALDFADALPDRVPEGQNLIAGIGVMEDDSHPPYGVILQGTHEGWTAALQTNRGPSPIATPPRIEGRTVTITVPWDELMGFRQFRWGASLRWYDFESTPQRGVGDKLPNTGPVWFPGARS